MAAGGGERAVRADIPRPADFLELQTDAGCARSAARPCRIDRELPAPARARRATIVRLQRAALPPGPPSRAALAGAGCLGANTAVRFRAQSTHPPLLRDQGSAG